jgi:hypothetical protein
MEVFQEIGFVRHRDLEGYVSAANRSLLVGERPEVSKADSVHHRHRLSQPTADFRSNQALTRRNSGAGSFRPGAP